MEIVKAFGWLAWLLVAIILVFQFVGFWSMCNFFPEGKRAWHFPVQIATLAHFAVVVLLNPWSH